MNANRVLGLFFTLAFLSAVLALTLAVPLADSVYSQGAAAWEVWLNGALVPTGASLTVEAGDTVEIVDRVWITNTRNLTFTLGTAWTESLALSGWLSSTGEAVATTGWLDWEVEDAEPNTWHVLTKTFEVLPGLWVTDTISETLDVDLIGEEGPWVVKMDYRAADLYITKAVDPANQVATELVTYTLAWGNDGGFAPGVVISDSLPGEVVFVDASPPGTYYTLTHEVAWGPFDLDTGDRMEATVWVTIRPDILPNILITNTAHLLYGDLPPLAASVSHRSMSPCVKVEAVAVTLLSLPPLYTNEQLQILADLSPDDASTPFRYQFVVDGVSGTLAASTTDEPLSLTLAVGTKGKHTVELRLWNCNMPNGQYVSDSFDVTIIPYLLYVPLITGNS